MTPAQHVLFITPYPIGVAPSQRFRFEQYFLSMEKEGIHFNTQAFLNMSTWQILYKPGYFLTKTMGILAGFAKRFGLLFTILRYDWVFIHREAAPIGPPILEWIIAKVFRRKVIYDFDDAIWLPNTSYQNRLAAVLKWHQKVRRICRYSQRISAGNEYLAEYARNYCQDVRVNPTTIEMSEVIRNKDTKPILTIGWTGTHSTMVYLDRLAPILNQLAEQIEFSFVVISNQHPTIDLGNLIYRQWRKDTELDDLQEIDIGVMPMPDDEWTRGKCGFKALQFMALGIPVVASAVGVNKSIIEDGVSGLLCRNSQDWADALKRLLKDQNTRRSMGDNGREVVRGRYSNEANLENFLGLFK